ncbi:dynamin family protein [Paraphaeosphaeria sporulosa]
MAGLVEDLLSRGFVVPLQRCDLNEIVPSDSFGAKLSPYKRAQDWLDNARVAYLMYLRVFCVTFKYTYETVLWTSCAEIPDRSLWGTTVFWKELHPRGDHQDSVSAQAKPVHSLRHRYQSSTRYGRGHLVPINPDEGYTEEEASRLRGFPRTIQDFDELPSLIDEAIEVMGLGPSKAFSKDVLCIEICGPNRPQLYDGPLVKRCRI